MATQKAIIATSNHEARFVVDRPIPVLRDDYILVKTIAVALNPTDWKHLDQELAPDGALLGCDYAGIVEEVGKNVKKPFKRGDRIHGVAHGGNAVQLEDGALAEYVVVKGDIQSPIPDNMSFQEAATLGVGTITVGQTLYQSLKLALPTQHEEEGKEHIQKPRPILIYGGSTATGTLAIQFAKLSNYTVLTTCSPHNFDLVRSLGADAVFYYNDTEAVSRIREYTQNSLKLVLDTIATESTAQYCIDAMSSAGGDYTAINYVTIPSWSNINCHFTLSYTALGEDFTFGPAHFVAQPEDKEFIERFLTNAEKLVADGKIRVHPPRLCPDGLKGVLNGMRLMKEGNVSGEKLVYNIADTPNDE